MTENEKQQLVDAVIAELKSQGTDISTATVITDADGVSYVICYDTSGNIARVDLKTLNEKSGIDISWDSALNLNDIIVEGVYNIKGNRLNSDKDNLPFANTGENASFAARLIVTTSPEGTTTYRHIVGQTLIIANAEGHETKVYTRSGNRTSLNGGVSYVTTWGVWTTLQGNTNVGAVSSYDSFIDNGIYSGVYTGSSVETFVMVVINDYDISSKLGQVRRVSQFKYSVYTGTNEVKYMSRVGYGDNTITWNEDGWKPINQDEIKTMVEDAIKSILGDIDDETLDTIKELADKVKANADAIVGVEEALADEIEKIKDGDTIVGQAREIHSRNGKNVIDSFLVRTTAGSGTIGDGVATLKSVGGNVVKNLVDGIDITNWKSFTNLAMVNGIFRISSDTASTNQISRDVPKISGHIYYASCYILCAETSRLFLSINSGFSTVELTETNNWTHASLRITPDDKYLDKNNAFLVRASTSKELLMAKPLLIDLTEMFGAGKEPTQAECDRLFGTMDALPQGLSFANPSVFKSTGWNQFNPANVIENKAIVDGAIVDGDKTLAIIPCLPCKIGEGENNGYHIHGDGVDENAKVYLTPLNPMEVTGELYMHELALSEKGSYVPQIKGYMIVEVPTTANLCAHFLWSEDCDKNAYEPYYESVVELPHIPEMSEYGLAGIQSSGTLACDEIDFVKGVYRKKIGVFELTEINEYSSYYDGNVLISKILDIKKNAWHRFSNSLISKYNQSWCESVNIETLPDKHFMIYEQTLYIRDTDFNSLDAFKSAMQGVMLYYELAEPIEYPLPKINNNYTSSDYGVELFDSSVPCNANNLYYMRSLAGETRNFLDKLYANTDKTDAVEVADYITNGIADNKAKAEEAPNLALRALFIAAGAEYNDTDNHVVKDTPWKNYVDSVDYKAQWDLDVVTGSVQTLTYGGKTYEYVDDNGTWKIIARVGDKLIWDDTKVIHRKGCYYLNGLGDITEEQMMEIYTNTYHCMYSSDITKYYRVQGTSVPIRTMLRSKGYFAGISKDGKFFMESAFFANNFIEVVAINYNDIVISTDGIHNAFMSATNLRHIIGYYKGNTVNIDLSIARLRSVNLQTVRNVNLGKASLICKKSILYMIQNANPTSAITITLHADAYARLKDDAEIVAALAAQPLVTLVSA